MLNGKGNGRLSWESRLKIAIGAARGIAHIQYRGKMALGNIKSSNIFLNSLSFGCVSDFGLAGTMIRPGYNLKIASDVYSFGVVLLELLTSKSALEPAQAGIWRNVDIVEWALSVRPEDWSSNLFDQSLWSSYQSSGMFLCDELDMFTFERGLELEGKIKAEMVEMLQIARRCLAMLPQDRPRMFEVAFDLDNIMCKRSRLRITTKLNCCLLRHYLILE